MGFMAFHEQSLLLTEAWQQHVNRRQHDSLMEKPLCFWSAKKREALPLVYISK